MIFKITEEKGVFENSPIIYLVRFAFMIKLL